jgi:SAM-dependent methyltransferase
MRREDDPDGWGRRAAAILDVARAAAAESPPPRGRAFFDLDHRSGTPLAVVDQLASRGIFRKYEHVLDLGGGLGATTRYMASRLGCTATATGRSREEAAAGRLLTARASLDWQVFHTAADATRLPFAEAAFTHVWALEALAALGPADGVLREAFRVLRPGGHLGIQELALVRDDVALGRAGVVAADQRRDQLERAGFCEIVTREVRADAPADTTPEQRAWRKLARRLGENDPHVRARERLASALAGDAVAIVQMTARRP